MANAVVQTQDLRYILLDGSGKKIGGPFDGAPDGGLTLANDALARLNSAQNANFLIDAIPTVAYASYTGPHG